MKKDEPQHENDGHGCCGGDRQLGMEKYEKDDWDEKEFIWREQALRQGYARPVMIHRAILGSVERFLAILIEHTGGNWPFWLSPRQIMICPVSEKSMAYAEKINNRLIYEGLRVDINRSNKTINKKILMAELAHYYFIIVVGEKEEKLGTVVLRMHFEGEVKEDIKPDVKVDEVKVEVKTEVKVEVKEEAKPDVKVDVKDDGKKKKEGGKKEGGKKEGGKKEEVKDKEKEENKDEKKKKAIKEVVCIIICDLLYYNISFITTLECY